MEDNPDVRELATATISGLGYRVLEASNGPSGARHLQHERGIDLLFSDVVLPDGHERLRAGAQGARHAHGLRALMTSGYANIHRPSNERPDVPLLLKPYRRDELAERIRSVLDRV